MKILVIDDNKDILNKIKNQLKKYDVDVLSICKDVDSIIGTYDIIIADYKLPGKSGVQIAKEIKKKDQYQKIIIISAYSEVLDVAGSGYCDKVLIKPILKEKLYKIIEKWRKV